MDRVTCDFFARAVKLLGKLHGNRYCGDQQTINNLIQALAKVEAVWKALPAPAGQPAPPEGETPS